MKKFLFLMAIAATLLFSTQSCKKDEDTGTDLTSAIVGSYDAEVNDSLDGVSNTAYPGETITITKVDNAGVRVTSSLSTFFPFNAAITETASGLGLTVASQQSKGQTIEGMEISGTYCGSYNSSTKKFVSAIKTTTGSPTLMQGTEASKQ